MKCFHLFVHCQFVVHEVKSNSTQGGALDPRLFLRDEELDRGLRLVQRAQSALDRAIDEVRPGTGLSVAECRLLLALRCEPNLSVTALREEMGSSVPSFARWLAKLDQVGLLKKAPGPSDGRRRLLSLSEAGMTLTESLITKQRDALRRAYRQVGADSVAGGRSMLEALVK